MKDPHVHAEKTPMPGFGHAAIRSIITEATGLVPSLPKTVSTGCGVRRPIAMTSTAPEKITCLACREWAREQYLTWAGMARAAADLAESGYDRHGRGCRCSWCDYDDEDQAVEPEESPLARREAYIGTWSNQDVTRRHSAPGEAW